MEDIELFNILLKNFSHLEKFKGIRIKKINDIYSLPFTTKDELKTWKLSDCPVKPVNITATSGTTSAKTFIFHSPEAWEMCVFRTQLILKAINIDEGRMIINLTSNFLNGPGKVINESLKKLGVCNLFFGTLDSDKKISQLVYIIEEFSPEIIISYTNQIFKPISEIGKSSVKKIVLTGEKLHPEFKKEIEKISGAKVYNLYGCNEFMGLGITENPDDEYLRLFDNGLLVEVINSEKKKQEGKLVITDLYNYSMPFIRYIVGDYVKFVKKGRKKYIELIGRHNEWINIDGELWSINKIQSLIFGILGHPEFYLLIEKDTSYRDIVILNLLEKDFINREKIKEQLSKWFGFELKIRKTKEIPKTETGKFRHLIDMRRLKLKKKMLHW